ncbi:MAG: MFS transporter, partial [Rhodobiaceae bacterium]|nr:MFS transporter [Rhodobiaceae bacterium]
MTSFSVRLSLFFAAIFLVIGVAMPYLPVWLESRGLSGAEIGVVVAVPMVMRVVFTPLMAVAAGRFATLSRAIAIFALLGTIPILAIHQASGFSAIVLAIGLSALFWNPVLPLTEALALAGVRRGSASYGRMRLWGSGSFIAANLGGGWILARIHPEQTIVIIAASYVACAAAAWALREP